MDHEPERPLPTEPNERLSMMPERLLHQLLHLIERRDDLIGAIHHLTPEQRAAESIAGGMAVREFVPTREPVKRNDARDVLLFPVPEKATRAHVYSTAGFMTIDDRHQIRNEAGNMPIPWELHHQRIGRVEFYDEKGNLIAIAGGELPTGHHHLAARL